jgi:hypothetical protein
MGGPALKMAALEEPEEGAAKLNIPSHVAPKQRLMAAKIRTVKRGDVKRFRI